MDGPPFVSYYTIHRLSRNASVKEKKSLSNAIFCCFYQKEVRKEKKLRSVHSKSHQLCRIQAKVLTILRTLQKESKSSQ
jgi:hypothetical protein